MWSQLVVYSMSRSWLTLSPTKMLPKECDNSIHELSTSLARTGKFAQFCQTPKTKCRSANVMSCTIILSKFLFGESSILNCLCASITILRLELVFSTSLLYIMIVYACARLTYNSEFGCTVSAKWMVDHIFKLIISLQPSIVKYTIIM